MVRLLGWFFTRFARRFWNWLVGFGLGRDVCIHLASDSGIDLVGRSSACSTYVLYGRWRLTVLALFASISVLLISLPRNVRVRSVLEAYDVKDTL